MQLLVDEFCDFWDPDADDSEGLLKALNKLPPQFLLRVVRQMQARDSEKVHLHFMLERCYQELASDEEHKCCDKPHTVYDKRLDRGTFKEPHTWVVPGQNVSW